MAVGCLAVWYLLAELQHILAASHIFSDLYLLSDSAFCAAQGVEVGDWWKDRLDCRQWGAHFPHVAGIAGQSNRGAQVCAQSR